MTDSARYHHGDLRAALLREADALLCSDGIDGLSLRKLAERVGVSRMAPYHHFRDKNALLSALAARGFAALGELVESARLTPGQDLDAGLREFVHSYLRFATDNPEQYDLMFGRTLWKQGQASDELRDVAFSSFRRYAERIGALLSSTGMPAGSHPLRLAQASWATLHGLCRLLIDGIYVDRADMEAVSEEAVQVMIRALREPD